MNQELGAFVSVIIVNWNGREWLKDCLDSLLLQTHRHFEIILVDNGSKDDSCDFVSKFYPDVVIVKTSENLGFAGGSNLGIKRAKGDFVLLLNNDTKADSNLLEILLTAVDEIPNLGAVNPRIVLMNEPDKLDNCGSYWTSSTFLYHYGFGCDRDLDEFKRPRPVFYNNGSAMLVKKELLDEYGLLDEDFWCYNEEGDLCHRLWLAGYECWYYPRTTVLHAKGSTSSRFDSSVVQFHNYKNRLLTYSKNFEFSTLLWVIPVHVTLNTLLSFYWLLHGNVDHFLAVHKATLWSLINIRKTISKRRVVQSIRVKRDRELFNTIKLNPPWWQYVRRMLGLLIDSVGN